MALECSQRRGWFGTGMFTEARMVWHWNVYGGVDGLALEMFTEARMVWHWNVHGGVDALALEEAWMVWHVSDEWGARLPFFFLACCLESEA